MPLFTIARRCVAFNSVLCNLPVAPYVDPPLLDANRKPLAPALSLDVSMVIVDDIPYSCIIGTMHPTGAHIVSQTNLQVFYLLHTQLSLLKMWKMYLLRLTLTHDSSRNRLDQWNPRFEESVQNILLSTFEVHCVLSEHNFKDSVLKPAHIALVRKLMYG